MNSRQYEKMRLAQHAEKEPKVPASQMKLLRHLSRKTESELAESYFNGHFSNLKEVKAMVKKMGWTWKEAKACEHSHLNYFLDPTISVYLDSDDRAKYKRMFKKDVAFLFSRGPIEEVHWYPTLDDIIDFLEITAILFKDPDHTGLSGIYFSKEFFEEDDKKVEFYQVTFSLDS